MADEDLHDEVERYRRAAEDALQQLDWCIGYLHGIRKTGISRSLSQNRNHIRQALMERSEQPLRRAAADISETRAAVRGVGIGTLKHAVAELMRGEGVRYGAGVRAPLPRHAAEGAARRPPRRRARSGSTSARARHGSTTAA